jgi:hypothetical protein
MGFKNHLGNNLKFYLSAAVTVLIALVGYYYTSKHLRSEKIEIARGEALRLSEKGQIQDGDIIFQTSQSGQSKAIQLATHSKYSHCGMIFGLDSGKGCHYYVLEAVQPVKWTPLYAWIARGEGGHYVIKRSHTDPMLPPPMLQELKTVGEQYLGKNYDVYFGWGDDKMYCSELIWKVYHRVTGLEFGHLQQLKDFDLSSEPVRKKMKERYGDHIPLNDTVISPSSIFDSELLVTVKEN